MRTPTFFPDLWTRDIALLPFVQQELAERLLSYARLTLNARPHHRSSKRNAASDRQTIFKHPVTGNNCLVLTVTRNRESESPWSLRIDFFDRGEAIASKLGDPRKAPRTQWEIKGERRLFLDRSPPVAAVEQLMRQVIALHE